MSHDILLIIVGGAIGLASSLITTLFNFVLENKRQKSQWSHEIEIRNKELLQKQLDDAHLQLEKENREKAGIIVPKGYLACFPGYTPVTLSNRDHKPIEQIKVGDKILSFDVNSRSSLTGIVLEVTSHDIQEYLVVNETLKITPSHGVWIDERDYVYSKRAKDLDCGDILVDENNKSVEVTSIRRELKPTRVYNLIIENNTPFFASGILVSDFSSKLNECDKPELSERAQDLFATQKRRELRERLLHEK